MPAFIALADSSTSGTNRMPSRKSIADDAHALDQGLGQHVVGRPAASSRMCDRLLDLFLEPVIEVVVHLLRRVRRRRAC